MRPWELCSGTGSVGKPWRAAGHEVMSLDIDPKSHADIICDILTWEYTDFALEPPDVIWCSPPCTQYSIARSKAKTPRNLEGADALVQRCLDIIRYWNPKVWWIENPQSGLLKTRPVIQGLPYVDLDYCQYGSIEHAGYRKRTRLWTNAAYVPRPLCTAKNHRMSAQKGPSKVRGALLPGDNCSLDTLHALPKELTQEILEVSTRMIAS